MPARTRTLAILVLGLLLAGLGLHTARSQQPGAAGSQRSVGEVSAAERAATFTFAPGTAAYDRKVILAAVDHARPEARRLLDVVDGLVDIRVGTTSPGTVGTAGPRGQRYEVDFNLGLVARLGGQRGIDRVVLHELGHVVDFALVAPAVRARMNQGVPTGYGCQDGVTGACTAPEEVFADSFAKWASGDIGADLALAGYRIPPPSDLAGWGAPLDVLGR
jgi:hypothetical protein